MPYTTDFPPGLPADLEQLLRDLHASTERLMDEVNQTNIGYYIVLPCTHLMLYRLNLGSPMMPYYHLYLIHMVRLHPHPGLRHFTNSDSGHKLPSSFDASRSKRVLFLTISEFQPTFFPTFVKLSPISLLFFHYLIVVLPLSSLPHLPFLPLPQPFATQIAALVSPSSRSFRPRPHGSSSHGPTCGLCGSTTSTSRIQSLPPSGQPTTRERPTSTTPPT